MMISSHRLCIAILAILIASASSTFLDRYEIGETFMEYSGSSIVLSYTVSDLLPDNTVDVATYSDPQCTDSIDNSDYLVPVVVYDDNPDPTGLKSRIVKVKYVIDYFKIQDSPVYSKEDNSIHIDFCTKFILMSDDGNKAVSTINGVVNFKLDDTGNFGGEFDLEDSYVGFVDKRYTVEAFFCDSQNKKIAYNSPKTNGDSVKICVTPSDDAIADGVYLERIDSFTLQRDDSSKSSKITQNVVKNGKAVDTSALSCVQGSELCYFAAIPDSGFYYGTGHIDAFGEAWLQVSVKKSWVFQKRVLSHGHAYFLISCIFRSL